MKREAAVRVLQVTIGDGSFGGVSSFLYTYYSHMDRCLVHFDFLYCGENSMLSRMDDPVLKDSDITALHILGSHDNGFLQYAELISALRKVFKQKSYDIVHVNSSNPYVNFCAAYALRGRSFYIAHSHNVKSTIAYASRKKQILKEILSAFIRRYIAGTAGMLFACSDEAGIYLFGKNGMERKNYRVIHNAIDTAAYRYDEEKRRQVRDRDDRLTVGFVGRLSDQKNPGFAIRAFAELQKRVPDSVLWIVGDGELRPEMEKLVSALSLNGRVIFWGQRKDVADLLQGMDVFLFPSRFEGFGIAAIEAQCSGLPVVASDQVPQAANITGLMSCLSLAEPPGKWADAILAAAKGNTGRKDMSEVIKKQNYDICGEAGKLERYYLRSARKRSGSGLYRKGRNGDCA